MYLVYCGITMAVAVFLLIAISKKNIIENNI